MPVGAEGKIYLAVTIDIMSGDAHVIFFCGAIQNHPLFPGGILKPDRLSRVDCDNVGPAIVVYISNKHGIAYAELPLNFLLAKTDFSVSERAEKQNC